MRRPTKPTPAVIDRICAALEKGATIEAATSCGPIARSTHYVWMAAAEADRLRVPDADSPHTRYADRVTEAMRTAELVLTSRVYDAACATTRTRTVARVDRAGNVIEQTVIREDVPPDWKAALAILERRWPDRWRAESVLHIGEPTYLSDEDRASAMLDGLERFLAARSDTDVSTSNGHGH
jgi:hypothetical protein